MPRLDVNIQNQTGHALHKRGTLAGLNPVHLAPMLSSADVGKCYCTKAGSTVASNHVQQQQHLGPFVRPITVIAVPALPYVSSPSSGWHRCFACTRIWCVRPVSSRHRTAAAAPPASSSTTS